MPSIPAKPASVRVKIWRRLQAVGAVGLRGSLYALPNREECVEVFEWLSRELRELGGQASICEGKFLDPSTDDEIERRFIDARNEDYTEIATAAKQLAKRLEAKRLSPEQIASITDQHAKLVHRLGEVAAIDFMHVPGREGVEGLLAAVARALPRDGSAASEPLEVIARPSAATWVTRTGVHVDRIASSWLIRRFIDPEATMKWLDKGEAPPADAVGFAFDGAHFTNSETRVTYEEMLASLDLAKNPALVKIGSIVHFLEVRGTPVPEAAGVQTLLQGALRRSPKETELLAEAEKTFDLLYDAYFEPAKR
jgi:hypothetical protein